MKHASHALGGPQADLEIGEIALDPLEAPFKMRQMGEAPRDKVVDNANLEAVVEECLDQVRTDEAGPASHEHPLR